MAQIQFEMIAKLSLPKESDKFKPYEDVEYASGWVNKTLKCNAVSGDNSFMLQVKGGCFKDGHNEVFVTGKPSVDADGKRQKGENFRIAWKDRLTSPRLVEVAEFSKFIIDLEEPNYRGSLQQLINKVKEGHEVTEEEVTKFGAKDLKGLEAALEKSNKKRKEFISEWDYAEFIYKMITSEKYKDRKFKIRGTYEMQYSESNGRWYNNYVPSRIYLSADDAEYMAEATVDFYFGADSLDNGSLLDKGKYYVNGYTFVYDSARKENIPAPYTISFPAAKDDSELEAKREKVQVKRFTVEDEDSIYQYGIIVKLLNGAQREELTEDMLTEEQLDSIMLGELTLEDIRRELGGSVYGERIVENVFSKPSRGFSKGREITSYTPDDLIIKPLETDTSAIEEVDSEDSLFDDDDDDLFN